MDKLPEGAHRDLVMALQELHRSAGWPGLRKVSETIKLGDFASTLSHERLRAILQGRGGLPRWINLEPSVRVLAGWCHPRRDPDIEAGRLQALWFSAAGHPKPVTSEQPKPGIPHAAVESFEFTPIALSADGLPGPGPSGHTSNAPASLTRPERLLRHVMTLEGQARAGDIHVELSRAGTAWDLEEVGEAVTYLRSMQCESYALKLLTAAGQLRPIAEIAMLTERLAESGQLHDATVVLRAAGIRRPTEVPLALVERLRASGRRQDVRAVLAGAGAQRPVLLLDELLAMLEGRGYGDETRMALNATVSERSHAEIRELIDLLDIADRTPQIQWILDRIAREWTSEQVAQFVNELGPATRYAEVHTVLDIVARHTSVNALLTLTEALRSTGRGVSADHVFAAAGRHRSIQDLMLIMRWCAQHEREVSLQVLFRGADEGGRRRFWKAVKVLQGQAQWFRIDANAMIQRAGISTEGLASTTVETSPGVSAGGSEVALGRRTGNTESDAVVEDR